MIQRLGNRVLHSSATVPEGEVELRYEFEPTGKPDVAHMKIAMARQ